MKAFITQSLTVATVLLAISQMAAPARAQFIFAEPSKADESKSGTDSAAVYANRILKRRLQTDKRLAVHLLPKEDGGADVYGSLPFSSEQLHLLLGRYQAFGQFESDNAGPKLKGSSDDKLMAATRFQAEQMILGNASADVKVLDELSAPPVADGEGGQLSKINALAGNLVESFDLAMSGRTAAALTKQLSFKAASKPGASALARIENNQLCLMALTGDISGAAAIIKKAANRATWQSNPAKFPINFLNAANILLANKDAKAALSLLEKLDGVALSGRLGLSFMRAEISAHSQLGDKAKVQELVALLVKRYNNNHTALTMAGDLAMQNENYKEAANYLKEAASLNKANPDSLIKYGICQAKMGDIDSAIKTTSLATRDFPQSPESHMALAKLHLENKEFLGARLQYERALEVSSTFAEKRQVFLPLMKVLDIMNEDKELLKQLSQWVKQFPNEPVCHYNRAFILAEKKQIGEAIDEYTKAISLSPKYNKARYNLALLYLKVKKPEEAKVQLQHFVQDTSGAEKEQAEKLLKTI